MLSKAVLKAIGSEVDEVFDRISDRFLGTKYVPHGIEFKVMTLEDFFKDIAEREGIDPDKDSLSTLKDIAESYLDSARERAKAQVTQSIQQVIREAILTGETPNIEVALEGALTKVWGDVTTHVHTILDSEINTARNVSIMEGITQYNAQIGVDDPVVFFVIVRDGAVCSECVRLHMMPDGVTPRVWKLSEVGSGYHKKGDPNPKIGGLHPHCRCIMTTLLPKFGFNASGMVTFIGEDHDEFAKQRGMAKSEDLIKSTRQTVTSGLLKQILGKTFSPDPSKRYSTNFYATESRIRRAPIAVHVPDHALEGIAKEGRLMTQFETGKSMGSYSPSLRTDVEKELFGIPEHLGGEFRPVYGALHVGKHSPAWHHGPSDHYGSVWFELKPEVKKRSTFTEDDSLDLRQSLSGPSPTVYSWKHTPTHCPHKEGINSYLEAQIHGGVYLGKDIKAIHMPDLNYLGWVKEKHKKKVQDILIQIGKQHKIPVYFHHSKVGQTFSHTETLYDPASEQASQIPVNNIGQPT